MPRKKVNKQVQYISEYNKENYKMYQFRVKRSDAEIIDKLDSIENRNSYLVDLIRSEIRSDTLTIKEIKTKVKPIMVKYHIDEVYLFGAYGRGEADAKSPVEFYCSRGLIRTLFERVTFSEKLEDVLGKNVNVVFIGAKMSEIAKSKIEEDKIKII